MDYDYLGALGLLRDARCKRKNSIVTAKFIEAVRRVNKSLPMLDDHVDLSCSLAEEIEDDCYSTALLRKFGPHESSVLNRVAKCVQGNGNCLFNSVSVILTG